jgi:hypothetical protein
MEASQAQLSAIEKRDDRLVSTMRKYVEALGGKLRLQACSRAARCWRSLNRRAAGTRARCVATAEAA